VKGFGGEDVSVDPCPTPALRRTSNRFLRGARRSSSPIQRQKLEGERKRLEAESGRILLLTSDPYVLTSR